MGTANLRMKEERDAFRALVARLVETFPEAGTDEEMEGGDTVEALVPIVQECAGVLKRYSLTLEEEAAYNRNDTAGNRAGYENVRVLVRIEGGLVQAAAADIPGVQVIVEDCDVEGSDHARIVTNWDGDPAFFNSWEPEGDEAERETIEKAAQCLAEADRRHVEAVEAIEEGEA